MRPLSEKMPLGDPQDFDVAHHHLAKLLGLVPEDSQMRHFKGVYWSNEGNVLVDIFKVLVEARLLGYEEDEMRYQWLGTPWKSKMYEEEKIKPEPSRFWIPPGVKFGMTAGEVRGLSTGMPIPEEVPDHAVLKRGAAASYNWEWSEP